MENVFHDGVFPGTRSNWAENVPIKCNKATVLATSGMEYPTHKN